MTNLSTEFLTFFLTMISYCFCNLDTTFQTDGLALFLLHDCETTIKNGMLLLFRDCKMGRSFEERIELTDHWLNPAVIYRRLHSDENKLLIKFYEAFYHPKPYIYDFINAMDFLDTIRTSNFRSPLDTSRLSDFLDLIIHQGNINFICISDKLEHNHNQCKDCCKCHLRAYKKSAFILKTYTNPLPFTNHIVDSGSFRVVDWICYYHEMKSLKYDNQHEKLGDLCVDYLPTAGFLGDMFDIPLKHNQIYKTKLNEKEELTLYVAMEFKYLTSEQNYEQMEINNTNKN